MHSNKNTKPHTEYEMLLMRQGWSPRCELLERKVTQLEDSDELRKSFTVVLCARLAAVLHDAAWRLEKIAAGQRVA